HHGPASWNHHCQEPVGPRRDFHCYFAHASSETRTCSMNETAKPNIIVMAEDDADDRLLIKDALKECEWDADLRFVENGEELLDYLLRQGKFKQVEHSPRPGLILLDLNMPRKDGREVLREIRAHTDLRRIPVVVLTTSKADTDIE